MDLNPGLKAVFPPYYQDPPLVRQSQPIYRCRICLERTEYNNRLELHLILIYYDEMEFMTRKIRSHILGIMH